MAKKNNRISITELEKTLKTVSVPVITVDWNGLDLKVKRVLTLDEVKRYVTTVADNCFSETQGYTPYLQDFMIRACGVLLYTNLTLPSNIDRQVHAVYGSDLWDTILRNVDRGQFEAICDAVCELVSARRDELVSAAYKQLDEVSAGFEELRAQIEGLFDGIDSETMTALADALSENGLDQAQLMRTYLRMRYGQDAGDLSDSDEV